MLIRIFTDIQIVSDWKKNACKELIIRLEIGIGGNTDI